MTTTKSYSKIYRIIHWLIAISFALLLLTIFLRLTWMNKDHMADIIGAYLSKSNQSLSRDELMILAKQIRQPMWQWHVYIGYALLGLFVLRFLLPFFGEMKFQNPLQKNLTIKGKFQNWAYLIFYVCVVASLISGLIIEHGPKSIKKQVEELHELSIYYLVAFIVIHLAGVFIAEFTNQKGVISRIISGSKNDVTTQ